MSKRIVRRKETESVTSEKNRLWMANEKAHELGEDGADVDRGAVSAAKAPTTEQLRKDIFMRQLSTRRIFTSKLMTGKTGMTWCHKKKKLGNVRKEQRNQETQA